MPRDTGDSDVEHKLKAYLRSVIIQTVSSKVQDLYSHSEKQETILHRLLE
jgi:hypothetical protein